MIKIDSSVFIQIINFLFLIWVLNMVLYRPIRNMIQKRKEKVTGLEKSIEGAQQDLTAKTESYASGIKEARAAGLKERDALIAEASIREKEVIAKINQRAREELTGLKEKIGKDAAGIRNILEKEVGSYAESIAQKILGRAD
jgi:F-type H+-transporting ATPase subunit b